MLHQRFLLPALLVLNLLRLAMLPVRDLSPDESLAVDLAGRTEWNWVEAGPLIPALVKLSTWLLGSGEFGVRFFAPLLALAASFFLWKLASLLFDRQTAAWSVLLLNALPAFNVAAVTLTPASAGFALHAGLAWAWRVAMRQNDRWHPFWFAAAGCLMLLIFADVRNAAGLVMIVLAARPGPGERSRLRSAEFGMVLAAAALAGGCWLGWNAARGWPSLASRFWEPCWNVLPSLGRWLLLASPLLLAVMLRQVRESRSSRDPARVFLFAMTSPLLLLDFGWGAWERWPHTGFISWSLFAAILAADFFQRGLAAGMEKKVWGRTAAVSLAAAMSIALMNTDAVRMLGTGWRLAQRCDERTTFSRFLSSDPSGSMTGWRETGRLAAAVIAAHQKAEPKLAVIASDWKLAAALSYQLTARQENSAMPPIVVQPPSATEPQPSFWPAFVPDSSKADSALFITDDAGRSRPPKEILRFFDNWETVSIAEIMHGGQRARTVKIFACHGIRLPD